MEWLFRKLFMRIWEKVMYVSMGTYVCTAGYEPSIDLGEDNPSIFAQPRGKHKSRAGYRAIYKYLS
jgi:hypothetical protein